MVFLLEKMHGGYRSEPLFTIGEYPAVSKCSGFRSSPLKDGSQNTVEKEYFSVDLMKKKNQTEIKAIEHKNSSMHIKRA